MAWAVKMSGDREWVSCLISSVNCIKIMLSMAWINVLFDNVFGTSYIILIAIARHKE